MDNFLQILVIDTGGSSNDAKTRSSWCWSRLVEYAQVQGVGCMYACIPCIDNVDAFLYVTFLIIGRKAAVFVNHVNEKMNNMNLEYSGSGNKGRVQSSVSRNPVKGDVKVWLIRQRRVWNDGVSLTDQVFIDFLLSQVLLGTLQRHPFLRPKQAF